jgi:hypothetical protein
MILALCVALFLPAQREAESAVTAESDSRTVERAVSLGVPGEFFVEDHLEPDGLRRVGAGSVVLSLPEDWDRSGALEVRLTWSVRDDFPIGEPAKPRLFVRGALVGEGDYYHSEWLHPDELDLDQVPILEVGRPDYGLDQGELIGHPYRGASSTLATATVVVDPEQVMPKDELLALYLEPEWNRWPQAGAVDGSLLSQARLRYLAR